MQSYKIIPVTQIVDGGDLENLDDEDAVDGDDEDF